ncbi:MAG: hypothetical protein ABI885_00510 [Gammaproteobacteria bacterium]
MTAPSERLRAPHFLRLATLSLLLATTGLAAAADKPSGAQKHAVEEYLDAVASGGASAAAFAIHPQDLEALRTRILTQLREEAARGDGTVRARLFGPGRPLAEVERLTAIDFYTTLGRKLYLFARQYKDADWLAAVPDKDGVVQILLRGKQDKEHGKIDVVNVVSVRPYGKDWKATLPTEIDAQLNDLMNARRSIYAGLPPPVAAGPPRPGTAGGETGLPPQIGELIANAGKALAVPNCEDYYNKFMSPNFRKVTSKKAIESLIHSCNTSMGTREMLVATIRIVKDMIPTFEYEGQRAVYDVSNQGLPFDRFVLEQVDKKWYIAE